VRRLYRSSTERQIGGVAGGLAEYTNSDPTLVRVLFIVLAVMGPGLLLYPLLWMFVPDAPRPAMDMHQAQQAPPAQPMAAA
jgi:phage shock protein PspC (stress-responsive transcriptional regulator)